MARDGLFVPTGWSRRWLDAALALWVVGFLGVALAAHGGQRDADAAASSAQRTAPGRPGPVRLAEDTDYLVWIESRTDLRRPPALEAAAHGTGRRKAATTLVSVTADGGRPVPEEALRAPTLSEAIDHRYWYADEGGHWQGWPTTAVRLKPGTYTLDTSLRGPGVRLAVAKRVPAEQDAQPAFLAAAGGGAVLWLFTVLRRRGIDRRTLAPDAPVLTN
ncbi:hypothetical protein [Streptomyces sp. NPDC048659]|uniref:hypothetical protein n=1 Tax=Streptomyces sp. NPDC048659 TaxID=3155489 RepID=UPI003440A07D